MLVPPFILASPVGLEPTLILIRSQTPIQFDYRDTYILVVLEGIEPSFAANQAVFLPLEDRTIV